MSTGLPNFGATYVPPGVYWAQSPTPVANPLGVANPSLIAIVGPAIGYETYVDSATISYTQQYTLTQLGINLTANPDADPAYAGVVVTSTDGAVTYVAGTDYVLTQTSAVDGNSIDTVTTIEGIAEGNIANGQEVVVSYQYTSSAYYTPTTCNNFPSVQAIYGPAFDTNTGAILSPLSFAAKFAFDNGASQVVLVATTSNNGVATRAGLSAGYTALSSLDTVSMIVPLPVGMTGTGGSPGDIINVGTDLETFLANQETQNNVLQTAYLGYETTVTVGPDTIAQDVAFKRVVEAWPNQMTFYNGFTNTSQVLPGYYLAAAYAGILASNPVQQGLTKQVVKDFSGIPPVVFAQMTNSYKNQLSSSGVAVTELTKNGQLQIRHGVTTDTSSVYNREISLVRAQDFMIETLVASVENAGLIGTPITGQTTANITGLMTSNLANLVTQGVIANYNGLTVTESSTDPTIINVTFQYVPSYPLNYITIVFSINTTSGVVTTGATNSGGSQSAS
jgi:hypothetical protein